MSVNVRDEDGAVHHLVDTTQRLLCGQSESVIWRAEETTAAVNCPACVRMLEDDVRRDGPTAYDSED
jgi:hypothetical protein